jgi:hypothetical protein
MPIDRTLCKLMTESLADSYDALELQFLRVQHGLKQLWAREETVKLRNRLDVLKKKMEQPRYYVGFLGRSQIGKSTTLNSILLAPPGEGPGTEGRGAPTTSSVTRLYQLDPEVGTAHQVALRFMTPTQFKERRDGLCQFLGFQDKTDDVILQQIDEQEKREREDPERAGKPLDATSEDRRYLARLLRSYKKFPELVTDPPTVQSGDYTQREEYTNHPRDADALRYLLLSSVEIGYRTTAISSKVELIDLPGLGARLFSDDLLTKAFLPQLDGALVFQSTEQVAAKEAYELLARLGERFRRMEGRVWMIITKFDNLASAHLGTTAESENILDNIHKTLGDNRVPLGQVLFVGNQYRKNLVNADGRLRRPTRELVEIKFHLKFDDSGKWILPPGFLRHRELARAFDEVVRDGGIERVRRVIGAELEQLVENEVREAVEAELRVLRTDLKRLLLSAEQAAKMDASGFSRAVHWKVELQDTRQELDRNREIVEAPTLKVMDQLKSVFIAKLFPERLSLEGAKLRGSHDEYAHVLQQSASHLCQAELVPAVFGWVSEHLRARYAILGDVQLNGAKSPLDAWEARKDADLVDLAWLAPILRLDEPPLFSSTDDLHISDRDYRAAMPRKLENLCHRAALQISIRVKSHLDQMIDGLALLRGGKGRVDAAAPALYREIIQTLG